MARKRKLNAAGAVPLVEEPQEANPAMGGMWGGTALNMLKQRLSETRENVAQGVINGTLALELEPDQILDQAGTDRLGDWQKDPEFRALVDNIKRRGQVQPIRVRPLKEGWMPQADDPLQSADTFIIQSGRRRLAACKELGLNVKAVLSTDDGNRALADLEERFHENTMRKNLSGFEELLSIGLIADALGDLTQAEIAGRLGVAQGDVSLGRSCVELHDQILQSVDVASTPKRDFRSIIPKLKGKTKGEESVKPAPKIKPVEVIREDLKVTVKPAAKGLLVSVKTSQDVDQEWLANEIAALLTDNATPSR